MDNKAVGLLVALAGLASMGVAHAAAKPASGVLQSLQPSSHAALRAPVQDAVALVKADDAHRAPIREIQGYGYYNYGPPPYAYEQPYYTPYAPYYYRYHHHHHYYYYHHHHHDWR